jgi:8-oxo-dGTP pyrophosphatase MutT (NUDIX family)
MLRLIPAPAHRQALRVAHRLRLVWWQVRKPRLDGCRVLAFDAADRVLLVRHAYGSGRWMLPGGGIGRGEQPLAAACREFAEEAGCGLARALLLEVLEEPLSGAVNRVHLVTGRITGTPRPDGREIIELACFAATDLPANLSPTLEARIAEWIVLGLAARSER